MSDLALADTQLSETVSRALHDANVLGHASIEAKVHEGVVVLSGVVPSRQALLAVEDLVMQIPGVMTVANSLAVQPQQDIHRPRPYSVQSTAMLLFRILLLSLLLGIFVLVGGIAIRFGTTGVSVPAIEIAVAAILVLGITLTWLAQPTRR